MGIWAKLLGTEHVVNTAVDAGKSIVDGLISAGDKIVYTEEEKAEARQKLMNTAMEFYKLTLQESSTKSITRRFIALAVVFTFDLLILWSAALRTGAVFWGEDKLKIAAGDILGYAVSMRELVLMVMFFYFGYYAVGNLMNKKNGK